jgi:hypothetical protein
MRILGPSGVLLGLFVIVGGCERKLTPKEAEQLLEESYSTPYPTSIAHFKCQEGSAIGSSFVNTGGSPLRGASSRA